MYIQTVYPLLTCLLITHTAGYPSCPSGTETGKAVGDLNAQLAGLQAQIQAVRIKDRALYSQIQSLRNECLVSQVTPTPVSGKENLYYNYMDEMAQASCVAMSPGRSWVFAVRRRCGGTTPSCAALCRQTSLSRQDKDARTRGSFTCFNALHVIPNRRRQGLVYGTDTGRLGLKVFRYNSCSWTNCGPNYCCCKTAY